MQLALVFKYLLKYIFVLKVKLKLSEAEVERSAANWFYNLRTLLGIVILIGAAYEGERKKRMKAHV